MHPKYAENSLDYSITRNRCQEILKIGKGDVCPPMHDPVKFFFGNHHTENFHSNRHLIGACLLIGIWKKENMGKKQKYFRKYTNCHLKFRKRNTS